MKNKKGISELLSYVLLITIAIAMAGGVYAYLRWQAENPPLPEPECDVHVALVDYYCDQSWIYLTLENMGLHSFSVKVRLYNLQGKIINNATYKTSRGAIGVLDVEGNDKQASMSLEFDETVKEVEILPFQIVPGQGQKFCPEAAITVPIEDCYTTTVRSQL
jgi:hypothetical protein